MREARWNRIKEIYHTLQPLAEEERERRLDELCGDDPDLREEVLAILAADEDGVSFLDTAYFDAEGGSRFAESPGPSTEGPGDRIGPYKLLQMIGEGGFGVVFMAEQLEPIRRRVALKVIKPGMDSKQVIARFEAERQALAMMDHPNIAKVLDAGTTPTGRPYFVMELVKGIPITTYCDNQGLDTRERLELFMEVCRAAEHAHQAGIIHRDIKPTNVLVTLHDGVPVPKVIDFGVAKAIRARLTEATLFTEFHQFIGTPAYMSPEQAAYEGLEVDPRSDVYSLGVVLYELLTGTTPIDSNALKRAAYVEVIRLLKEEEPPRPSTRVTTVGQGSEEHAKKRGSDPHGLARLLRGDLDWIVMKALEKDRRRRYDSAADMAEDIGRYFESRPIEARPPSLGYKARKLLRRRRGPFAAAAVVVLALVGDVAYVGFQRSRMADLTTLPQAPVAGRSELLFTSDDHWCFDGTDVRPSPDGTKVAYANTCDSPGVYVVDNATGEARLVSEQDWHWGLDWSPDGTRIVAGLDDRLDPRPVILDLTTGASMIPASLANLTFQPNDWSSDGEWISGGLIDSDRNVTTAVVSLATGEVTPLAEGVRQGQAGSAISPDGRFVAFGDMIGEMEDLFVVELETGDRWRLTETEGTEGELFWSPDGSYVAYSDPEGLWALPVSSGRPTGPARLLRTDDLQPRAWTEHGFYYTVSHGLTQAYRIPVDPQDGRPTGDMEPLAIPGGDFTNMRFAWAPDMSAAAVAGWGDGMIHLVEGERHTSYSVGLEVLPSNLWWSVDGRELLYTSPGRAQRDRVKHTVMALDIEDGTTRALFEPTEGLFGLHVAPDGRTMVHREQEGVYAQSLVVSELGAAEGRIVATSGEPGEIHRPFGQPLFSPTGELLVYMRIARPQDPRESGVEGHDLVTMSLWVVAPDGTGERKIAEAPGGIGPAKWDPTGRMIAYMAGYRDPSLEVVDVKTGETHEIEAFSKLGWRNLLDWSPDGRWLAVSETIGRSELWVDRDVLEEGVRR